MLHLGDCDVIIHPDAIRNPVKTQKNQGCFFRFELPVSNPSPSEQALLIFASAFFVPKKVESENSWVKLSLAESPREDGYFEATLIKPKKTIGIRFDLLFLDCAPKGETFEFDLSLSYYGRSLMQTKHFHFNLPLSRFSENEAAFQSRAEEARVKTARKPGVVPIRTHLIMPGEDLAGVIRHYTKNEARPGDWVAIAESVVAIVQGRVYPVETIQPGFWARRLNRFFQFDASMASPYSMECAIRERGLLPILAATLIGIGGKIIGRSGDFYRIAGRGVATIDDCTGTLPPFDKSVVMGPKDADMTAKALREKTGLEIAIVDANDLGKVDILGKSAGIIDSELVEAIRDNPQGNASEQTPIVLLRR